MSLPESYLLEIERWRAETVRLHHKWRGPYLDLCLAIFIAGGAVPNVEADLAFKARLSPAQFARFWPAVRHLFLVSGEEVRHPTATQRRADWDRFIETRRQNGAEGGKKTQQKQREARARAKAMESDLTESPPIPPEQAAARLAQILSAQHLVRQCRPESLAAVCEALVEFDGQTFRVAEACADRRDWALIRQQVESWRYRLELSEQRILQFPRKEA